MTDPKVEIDGQELLSSCQRQRDAALNTAAQWEAAYWSLKKRFDVFQSTPIEMVATAAGEFNGAA